MNIQMLLIGACLEIISMVETKTIRVLIVDDHDMVRG